MSLNNASMEVVKFTNETLSGNPMICEASNFFLFGSIISMIVAIFIIFCKFHSDISLNINWYQLNKI